MCAYADLVLGEKNTGELVENLPAQKEAVDEEEEDRAGDDSAGIDACALSCRVVRRSGWVDPMVGRRKR